MENLTIQAAVRRAMDEWKRGGTNNVDRMRELIDWLVEEAIGEWLAANIDATTDEEEDFDDIRDSDPHEAY